MIYENEGKIDVAKKYYEKGIELGDGGAAYNLGILYENEGKIDIAKKYYEKAEKLKTANNE